MQTESACDIFHHAKIFTTQPKYPSVKRENVVYHFNTQQILYPAVALKKSENFSCEKEES